jgi:hypothetical protein
VAVMDTRSGRSGGHNLKGPFGVYILYIASERPWRNGISPPPETGPLFCTHFAMHSSWLGPQTFKYSSFYKDLIGSLGTHNTAA